MTDLDLTTYKALSFDCYGTLIDWEAGIAAVLAPWAREQGVDLTDEDLLRTITRGVRGTAMLGHPGLPVAAQRALVAYLRTFSSREPTRNQVW